MRRLLVLALTAVSLCAAGAQRVAVYQSEANEGRYHGLYQEPLRTWLKARGQEFTAIGDAVAADPEQLARYPVVLASSAYVVPRAAGQGLAAYLERGGSILWIDAPALCEEPAFRAALGLSPETAYMSLLKCTVEAKAPPHPAVLTTRRFEAPSLVGNCAVSAAAGAKVLCDLSGSTTEGKPAHYPALIAATHGRGRSLVYNWIVWRGSSEALALLGEGLDYLLAGHALRTQPAMVTCAAPARIRQPDPVRVACTLYRRPGGEDGARCELSLLAPDGKTTAGRRAVVLADECSDGALAAAAATAEIPTAGLDDGEYRLRCRVRLAGEERSSERTVLLEGRHWEAIRRAAKARTKMLRPILAGTLGDYDSEPRTPQGRVDIPRLMEQITTAHMNTYDFLVWHAATDWEDLRLFLPAARAKGIKVWVTLCPPSEQGGQYPWSEPYRLDFVRWAEEIGRLSKEFDNLVALVIDDFWSGQNHTLYTPEYIDKVTGALRRQNPRVAFLATIYWPTVGDKRWIEEYGLLVDGIVFPYDELETGDQLAGQLRACREWIGPDLLLLTNVYATGSGGAKEKGPRTPEYLRKVLTLSRQMCDGVRIYCLPKAKLLDDYRYAITADLYGKWRAEQEGQGKSGK